MGPETTPREIPSRTNRVITIVIAMVVTASLAALIWLSIVTEGFSVIGPFGMWLLLFFMSILGLCLIFLMWGMVRSIKRGARKKTAVFGIVAVGIVAFSAYALSAAAPRGGRTIAQLTLPDGREFLLRHYRFSWLDYPKVRFYVHDTDGTWTSISVISELISPNSTTLTLDSSGRQIEIGDAGGTYVIQDKYFANIDGGGGFSRQLPPGIEPGEEDIRLDMKSENP